jgi:hypothetical protein
LLEGKSSFHFHHQPAAARPRWVWLRAWRFKFGGDAMASTILFPFGQTVITPGALEKLSSAAVNSALDRHAKGDWGDVPREDWQANERALEEGTRLLSSYRDSRGVKFWIITEADRSATTVLLPEEY